MARLLRGALLTINRDAGEAVVTRAIASWPSTPRLFATMRLRDRGVEDWERRLHAARGVADTMQEAAIPLLLRAAEQSLPPGRQRALLALGDLVERPRFDPCGPVRGATVSSEWTRPIRPIGDTCGGEARNVLRNRLVPAIRAYANDPAVGTREAVAIALGQVGMTGARPILRRLLRDPKTSGLVCAEPRRCAPRYPVRDAAREALDNIAEIERNWRRPR